MATDWAKLTVVDLRAELKKRGLPQAGKKAELVSRIEDADAAAQENAPEALESPELAGTKEDEYVPAKPSLEESKTVQTNLPASNTGNTVEFGAHAGVGTVSSIAASAIAPVNVDLLGTNVTSTTKPSDGTDVVQPAPTQIFQDVASNAPQPETTPAPSEIAADIQSRKRRSRSPIVQAEDVARKRAKMSDTEEEILETKASEQESLSELNGKESMPSAGVSSATLLNEVAPIDVVALSNPEMYEVLGDNDLAMADDDMDHADRLSTQSDINGNTPGMDRADIPLENKETKSEAMHDEADVTSAIHPATCALYIKNFMRPLRENVLRDYLVELATPLDAPVDPSIVVEFFLDQIRTHAFVLFTSIAAASRTRIALHGKIWPDETNRKELWADFIPPENVKRWIEQELEGSGGRGNLKRWEIRYEDDSQGVMTTSLVEADAESVRPAAQTSVPGPVAAPPPVAPRIPTGPARIYPGIESAPRGPRGGHGPPRRDAAGESVLVTRAQPCLQYQPVASEIAEQRLINMRSYFTKDLHRDMGREDEINRYTFADTTEFVDRGKEVFIGIRPPHRENERRRNGVGGHPPSRPLGRRHFGGGGGGSGGSGGSLGLSWDPPRHDEPRSRFTGEPLSSYSDYAQDRRGGRSGRRRDQWNDRY